ncbi:hypothetical protein Tco_1015518, partial [Tanacetum coccineum]
KSLQNLDAAIMKKLYKILENGTFISRFPQVQACFLPFIVSDHSQAVMEKGNLTERVAALKEEMRVIQIKSIENVHDAEIRKAAVKKLMEYNEAVNDELKLLYQMAKVEWLQEGDRNTAYFHQVIKGRKHRSFIDNICDENGTKHSEDEVPKQFVKHFKNFIGRKRNTYNIKNKAKLFTKQVNDYEANILCKEVTLQGVEEALKSIDDNKAPRPDGYTTRFFKAAWEIVRSDVYDAIKEFF